MRNIVNIKCGDNACNGVTSFSTGTNELLITFIPSEYHKTNLHLSIIDVKNKTRTVELDSLYTASIPMEYWKGDGVMMVRLESNEATGDYITFNTMAFNSKNDICVCKTDDTFTINICAPTTKVPERVNSTITHGTLQALNEVVSSYIRQNENIVYAHKHDRGGLPEDDTKTYGNSAMVYNDKPERVTSVQYGRTGWACNCTTFVLLCLMGVPFEYSAYVEENLLNGKSYNHLGKAGYCFNIYGEEITEENFEDWYNTRRMYDRFKELNCAEPITSDYSNVNVGDVVWFSPDAKMSDTEQKKIDEIGHVGIVMSVLNRFKDGDSSAPVLVIAECTSATYTIKCKAYSSSSLITKGVYLVGKPVYQNVIERETEILMAYDSGGSKRLIEKQFDLYNQEMVTLECDFKPTAMNQYIRLWGNGEVMLSENRHQELTQPVNSTELNRTKHLVLSFPFVLANQTNNGKPVQITSIELNCENSDTDNLTNVKLYKGFKGPGKTHVVRASSLSELKTNLLALLPTNSNKAYTGRLKVALVTTTSISDESDTPVSLSTGNRYGDLHFYVNGTSIEFTLVTYYRFQHSTITYRNSKLIFKNTSLA